MFSFYLLYRIYLYFVKDKSKLTLNSFLELEKENLLILLNKAKAKAFCLTIKKVKQNKKE